MLLELEAPIKICGTSSLIQATFTDNTPTWLNYSNTPVSLETPTTYFWGTTSTGENSQSRQSASCWPTRSKILKIFSCSEATTSAPASIVSTASMTSVLYDLCRQAQVQHQTVENLLRCLQRHARLRPHRLKNNVYARRTLSSAIKPLANPQVGETSRSSRSGTALWLVVGRSWKGDVRMGRERARSELYIWQWHSIKFFEGPGHRSGVPCSPGGRGGLWIFCQAAVGDDIQCSQLLRVILEFRSGDERRRVPDVLVSDSKVLKEEKVIL